MKKLLWTLLFFAVATVNYFAQFASWAYADGQSPSVFSKHAWQILSFPTFWFSPEKLANEYFMPLLLLNSMIWSVVIFTALYFAVMRTRN